METPATRERVWPLAPPPPGHPFHAFERAIRVRRSGIRGAGLGAFTTVRVPRGTALGVYTGEQLTATEEEERYPRRDAPATYVLRVRRSCGGHVLVDAANAAHWAKYMNDPWNPAAGVAAAPNVVFGDDGVITAVRDIGAGEELLVSYGAGYWRETPEASGEARSAPTGLWRATGAPRGHDTA